MGRVKIGYTIDSDAKVLLEKLAQLENRSVANYLETLIRGAAEIANVKADTVLPQNGPVKQRSKLLKNKSR